MTAVSDLLTRNASSEGVLQLAELWSKKSLEIATQHSSASNISNTVQNITCDAAMAVAAFNIGILKKVR